VTTDQATEFFDGLTQRGHEPLLNSVSGTLRFDLTDGPEASRWYVQVKKGDVRVSHDDLPADVVVGLDRDLFLGMVEGKVNAMAAVLRGEVSLDGDLGLVISFQRLFPGPPRTGAGNEH
jgi:putative sterol carrier protein